MKRKLDALQRKYAKAKPSGERSANSSNKPTASASQPKVPSLAIVGIAAPMSHAGWSDYSTQLGDLGDVSWTRSASIWC